jgi:hypothetical protein
MKRMKNNEESWEQICLASGLHTTGEPYPVIDFDFYVEGVSEDNLYLSNKGIELQIKSSLELNPSRQKVVYFYYKLNGYGE